MSQRVLRPRGGVCQLCELITGRKTTNRLPVRFRKALPSSRQFNTAVYAQGPKPLVSRASIKKSDSEISISRKDFSRNNGRQATEAELEQAMIEVRAACDSLLALTAIPSENEIAAVLAKCDAMAKLLVFQPPTSSIEKQDGAASALLDLDDSNPKKLLHPTLSQPLKNMVDNLSSLAYSIVKHPPVFIAPQVLRLYVSTQASLKRPETLPEVFELYANKPLPVEKTSPIRYSKQNPNNSSNCIPAAVAEQALQAALDAKELVVAMDIIEASYTTKAFYRDKFIRKALLPATALVAAPVAAYAVASQFADFQTTMDHGMATNIAFAGIISYLGFTATMGVIAITTANDQMDRVTWAPGVPLRQRWMREDERAALDKVASTWGFKETWRRGEEEGEDWDALREWINRKDMMLDRVELMEGME